MQKLNSNARTVRRVTAGRYSVLYPGSRNAREIVVQLAPGDLLQFREKGRRQVFALPIEEAFRLSVRRHAAASRQEHKAQRPRR